MTLLDGLPTEADLEKLWPNHNSKSEIYLLPLTVKGPIVVKYWPEIKNDPRDIIPS